MVRKIAVLLSLLLLANTLAYAQSAEIPLGRWNKLLAEKPGTGIIVTLHGGEVIPGFYKSLSNDMLTVLTDETKERTLPKTAVEKVMTREKRSGPLWNGAVIGAAIPATIGIIGCSAYDGERGPCFGVTAIWAAIGAGVGVGIDALYKGQITLYKAPKPQK
jgi:hypothetical protein